MTELGSLSWPEVEAHGSAAVLAVPVGATEQHGPHLPLSTDTAIAAELCSRWAAADNRVLVAPPLAYGSSGEHADFAGTISIGAEATELVLVELCRSASRSFEVIVLVSTHGGNSAALQAAVERLRGEGRDVRAFSLRCAGDAHAGLTETSLMLAIAAAQVRLELAAAGNTAPLSELLPRLRAEGVRASAANGVLGDPAGASAVEGERLLAVAVAELQELLATSVEAGARP